MMDFGDAKATDFLYEVGNVFRSIATPKVLVDSVYLFIISGTYYVSLTTLLFRDVLVAFVIKNDMN